MNESELKKRNMADGQNGFSFRGAKLWSNLAIEIKSAPTIINFKNLNWNGLWHSSLDELFIYLPYLFLCLLSS